MSEQRCPRAPLALLLGSAISGVLLWSVHPLSPGLAVALFFPLLAGWLLSQIGHRSDAVPVPNADRSGRALPWSPILLALLCLVFFWFRATWQLDYYPDDHLVTLTGADDLPVIVEARIVDMPQLYVPESSWIPPQLAPVPTTTFLAEALRIRNGLDWQKTTGRILVTVDGDVTSFGSGDCVRLKGKFSRIRGPSNPYDWDRAFMWRTRRVLVRIHIALVSGVELVASDRRPEYLTPLNWARRQAGKTFDRWLQPRTAAVARAMVLGLRNDLDADTQELFRQTGTVHLLAISGMHLGLVAGFLYVLFRCLGLSRRQLALILLVGIVFYILMTDMRPPILRAGALVCAGCIGILFDRRVMNLNSLSAAGLFILILSPGELYQFGTQLSFLATGVFLWQNPIKTPFRKLKGTRKYFNPYLPIPERRRKLAQLLRSRTGWSGFQYRCRENIRIILRINLVMWLVLLPLILLRTNLFTPIAVLVNPLLWIPMTAAMVFCIALMIAGWFFPPLCSLFAWGVETGFGSLFFLLQEAQRLPGGSCYLPSFPGWWCLVFYAFFVVITLFPNRRLSIRTGVSLLVVWLLVGFMSFPTTHLIQRSRDRVQLEVLAVGHGGSSLVTFPDGRTMLFDCGSFSQGDRAGERAARALWRQGRTSLDLLVLSHADSDHYNGYGELANRIAIRQVVVSPYMFQKGNDNLQILARLLRERKTPLAEATQGDSLAPFGFPELTVLHPPRHWSAVLDPNDANPVSLVVELRYKRRSILFTGDLSADEAPFTATPGNATDVLFLPHHGGFSPNTEPLIHWCRPTFLVVCDGTLVRNDSAKEQWRQRGFPVLSTLEDGWIQMDLDPEATRIHTWNAKDR